MWAWVMGCRAYHIKHANNQNPNKERISSALQSFRHLRPLFTLSWGINSGKYSIGYSDRQIIYPNNNRAHGERGSIMDF